MCLFARVIVVIVAVIVAILLFCCCCCCLLFSWLLLPVRRHSLTYCLFFDKYFVFTSQLLLCFMLKYVSHWNCLKFYTKYLLKLGTLFRDFNFILLVYCILLYLLVFPFVIVINYQFIFLFRYFILFLLFWSFFGVVCCVLLIALKLLYFIVGKERRETCVCRLSF